MIKLFYKINFANFRNITKMIINRKYNANKIGILKFSLSKRNIKILIKQNF